MAGERTLEWDPLCTGVHIGNRVLSVAELKERLCALLDSPKFGVKDQESWVRRAREISLASNASRVICRFLLFSAADNSLTDSERPGMLKAEGLIESDQLRFLKYENWVAAKYATIEHVAPVSGTPEGWRREIYERPHST